MSNHLHFIGSCANGVDLSDTLRDFKKFTSTAIVNAIESKAKESRKNWLLWLLRQKDVITFWQPGNHPEEIRTREFFQQELDYIHNNPIRAGWIDKPEAYIYSSARDFYGQQGLIRLTPFY
jgi:putative transposase